MTEDTAVQQNYSDRTKNTDNKKVCIPVCTGIYTIVYIYIYILFIYLYYMYYSTGLLALI